MSLWSKIKSAKIINWMMKNKQKQPTGGVEPIQLTVAHQELSSNCESEPHASTSTSVFTLQDEVNQYTQQNQNLSVADECFGDIGRFSYLVRNDDTISPLSPNSGGTENVGAIPNASENTGAVSNACENIRAISNTGENIGAISNTGENIGAIPNTGKNIGAIPNTGENIEAISNAGQNIGAIMEVCENNSNESMPNDTTKYHCDVGSKEGHPHFAPYEPVISPLTDVDVDMEAASSLPGTSVSAFTGNREQENVHTQQNTCSVYVISRLPSAFPKPKFNPTANKSSDNASNESPHQEDDRDEPDIIQAAENAEEEDNFENEFVQEVLFGGDILSENASGINKPSSYIRTHLEIMYVFGASTFSTNDQENQVNTRSLLCHRCVSWLQMILFVSIVALSTLQSFCDAKYIFISFLSGGGLNQLVRAAFCLTCLVSSAYGAYIFYYKKDDLSKMVNAMTGYEQNLVTKNCSYFTIILAITTIFMAFLKPILVVDFNELSFEAVMLQASYVVGEDIFVWDSTNVTTVMDQLDEDYGTNLSSLTIGMGAFKLVRDFSYNLQQGLVWDFFANMILAMYAWMLVFMAFVNSVKENLPENQDDEEKRLQRKRIIVWKMYREIRNVFAAVNEVFSPLLMLFHVTNVLRYAFLMERIIFPDNATMFTYIHLLYDIVKSEVIYLSATSVSQQNKTIRKWLRNWALESGKIDLGTRKLDLTAVLDELDEEPLGLGQGDFVIDKNFHFGLLGLVSSLFVVLANKTGVKP